MSRVVKFEETLMCRKEKGGVLVLTAILAAAVIAIIALGLDASRMAEVAAKGNNSARLASLAATESFFAQSPAPIEERLCAAYKAAQLSVEANSYSGQSGNTEKPRIKPHAVIPGCPQATASDVSGPGATLQPGLWHASMPPAPVLGSANPCQDNYPCFQPFDPLQVPAVLPTTFRIDGEIYKNLSYFLASSIFDTQQGATVSAGATATVMPRRIVFAVDISPSMVRETHLDRPLDLAGGLPGGPANNDQKDKPSDGLSRDFAYYTTRAPSFPCARSGQGPTTATFAPNTGDPDNFHNIIWNFLCSGGNESAPVPVKYSDPAMNVISTANAKRNTVHYLNDYRLKAVMSDLDYNTALYDGLHPNPASPSPWGASYSVGNQRRSYMVDLSYARGVEDASVASVRWAPQWAKPEPLSTVFSGLFSAVILSMERQVSGDRIGITFFDNRLTWPRTIYPTNNFEYIANILNFFRPRTQLPVQSIAWTSEIGAPGLEDDNLNTITSANINSLDNQVPMINAIRREMFPGFSASTDLALGVTEAMSQLAQARLNSGNQESQDGIVLVTDGLATCCQPTAPTGWPGGNFGTANRAAICAVRCGNDYAHWNEAMTQLEDIVRVRVVPSRIPIHVMLVGSTVRPHSNLIQVADPSGTLRCINDEDARKGNISMVHGLAPTILASLNGGNNTAWDEKSPTLANATSTTGPASTYTGPFFETNKRLYKIAQMTKGRWMPLRITRPGETCTPIAANCAGVSTLTTFYRDPQCRSAEAQAQDYMISLMKTNPYVLVQ